MIFLFDKRRARQPHQLALEHVAAQQQEERQEEHHDRLAQATDGAHGTHEQKAAEPESRRIDDDMRCRLPGGQAGAAPPA